MSGSAFEDVWPLSPLQEGLLFHVMYDRNAPDVYAVQQVVNLAGNLNARALRAALESLLARHANLRAGFPQLASGRVVQVVAPEVSLPWQEVDLSERAAADAQAALLAEEQWALGFDLARPPLFRAVLIRLGALRHQLVLTGHHILIDGWSMPLLARELLAIYAAGTESAGLPPVRPYKDYLAWLARQDRATAVKAWKDELAGLNGPTLIAPGSAEMEPVIPQQVEVELSERLSGALGDCARVRGLTLNTIFQGAWGLILGRLTGRSDVVFGTTVAGRPAELPGIESMLGLFINTVPVRVQLNSKMGMVEVFSRTQDRQSALIPYRYLGLSDVQREAGVGTLFDTLVVYENYPIDLAESLTVGGMEVSVASARDAAHYPLTLTVFPGRKVRARLSYRADVFEKSSAEQFLARLVRVLEEVAEDPERSVASIDILGRRERDMILRDWNAAELEVPKETFAEGFESQVLRIPDAIAVSGDGESLTFAALNSAANQLANYLIGRGVGPEQLVALALPRSASMVTAVLAVLKAGAAYLPVDPEYPSARIGFMIADAAPACIITTSQIAAKVPHDESVGRVLVDDQEVRADLSAASAANPRDSERVIPLRPGNSAYVIYTSGSTGRPKAVVTPHGNLVGFAAWAARDLGRRRLSKVLASSSLSFDPSVLEILAPLYSGGHVDLAENLLSLADNAHAGWAGSLISGVPSVLATVVADQDLDADVEFVLVAGEVLTGSLIERIRAAFPRCEIANLYGPTEATVYSAAWYAATGGTPEVVPIGKPLANAAVYVLDDYLQPVPPGVTGELYISGPGLARGYLGQPTMTAERYVACPFRPGDRMYRTGDLVRWTANGDLAFVGRADDQVKVRGFRVELGEVEAVLARHEAVGQVAMAVREGHQGEQRLVAYIVPNLRKTPVTQEGPEKPDLASSVRAFAATQLPAYMVPGAVIVLDELPLTVTGKLDRSALPMPDFASLVSASAAETSVEEELCGLFAATLGLERVGVEDSFFEIGGDSILSLKLIGLAGNAGMEFTPRDLFQRKTPRGIARLVEDAGVRTTASESVPTGSPVTRGAEERPRSATERVIAGVWAEVLDVSNVPVNETFSGLGGHLTLLPTLAAKMSDALGREVELRLLLRDRKLTVESITMALEAGQHSAAARPAVEWPRFSSTTGLSTVERRLDEEILDGSAPSLDAAAVTYVSEGWQPDPLHVEEEFMSTGAMLGTVLSTPVGRIGMLVMPISGSTMYRDEKIAVDSVARAVRRAAQLGAKAVSLTGLIPSATRLGTAVVDAVGAEHGITTGHAVTASAVVLTLADALSRARRSLEHEELGFVGLGSIGVASLRCLLSTGQHPRTITLCDLFDRRGHLEHIAEEARKQFGYSGEIRILSSRGAMPPEAYDATVVVGATSMPDIVDVSRVKAGTIFVDDSAPHCFSVRDAITRMATLGDVLFLEAGIVRSPVPISEVRYFPAWLRNQLPSQPGISRDTAEITGCVLAAGLHAYADKLPPTIGPVDATTVNLHGERLAALGFSAARAQCSGRPVPADVLDRFWQYRPSQSGNRPAERRLAASVEDN